MRPDEVPIPGPRPPRPRRRRWSLSIRGMMLLILIVGGPIGWEANRVSRMRRAVAILEAESPDPTNGSHLPADVTSMPDRFWKKHLRLLKINAQNVSQTGFDALQAALPGLVCERY